NLSENINLPQYLGHLATGATLFNKEISLSSLSGEHLISDDKCFPALHNILAGRLTTTQTSNHVFSTRVDGIGIRLTLIFDKAGVGHREWTIPFNVDLTSISNKKITTNDFKVRIELLKYR
ncbi:fimbrial protein, partial [Enterobacter cloacae complex sp. P4RS]|nr:fimbrial protein [Enterobacter cloacae complex sp. P4RS]